MAGNRPKGYIKDWQPSADVAYWIRCAREVLTKYSGYGPMTVRQIFYALVGNYEYDKTELAYKRLASYLVKARRAQLIDFSSIRDDGGTSAGGRVGYGSVDEFLADMQDWGSSFSRDRMAGQPFHIELWCEAEGMVPMLGQMTRNLGVRVTGTGGFSSVTVTHRVASDIVKRDRPTVLLHVGDYDPSGESIFESMCQDIGKFVVEQLGGRWNSQTGETLALNGYDDAASAPLFRPRRIALTEEQVEEYDLPTAPPKRSDSRSANWIGETTQAEAMPPDLLETVVVGAVEEYIDQDLIDAIEQDEQRERGLIGDRVTDAIAAIRAEIEE